MSLSPANTQGPYPFPWSKVSANVLRTVVRDVGAPAKVNKRDEMVEFLEEVVEYGCTLSFLFC